MRALEEAFPRSLRQRCLAHEMRNREAKVPLERWPEAKSAAWSAYTAAGPELAERLRDELVRADERELPAATACFVDDFAALLRAAESWRGVRATEFELRQRQLLRNELRERFGARRAPIAQPINPISRNRFSSNRGT